MNPRRRWLMFLLLGPVVLAASAGEPADLDAVLTQAARALEGMQGIVAEVDFSETVGEQSIDGAGTLHLTLDGFVRAEIGGSQPRTLLYTPPFLYIYRHSDAVVAVHDLTSNPDLLGQYITVGFNPAGRALRKRFDVRLESSGPVDGVPSHVLELTPKSKQKKGRADAVAWIRLWLDAETGLPLQQEIVHRAMGTKLVIRYRSIARDEAPKGSLYRPDWPEGVTVVGP